MEVLPVTPSIGAEVYGLELETLGPDDAAVVRSLWLRYGVLIFRDQTALTRRGHVAFARLFAAPEYLSIRPV